MLDEGVRVGFSGTLRHVSESQALAARREIARMWRAELATRARAAPDVRFPNPSPREFHAELRRLAEAHDFRVISVEFLMPRQLAPKVVVQSKSYVALARATPAILARLDPKRRTSDDRTGWGYEGFYFEAVDEKGVPFLIVHNFWRGEGPGGGQWARSESLYPFDHL